MYNETYDDYIRSILGYPRQDNMINNSTYDTMDNFNMMYDVKNDFEQFYPEIYRIIAPMVKKACSGASIVPNEQVIDRLVEEIYTAIENDNVIALNINLENETKKVEYENRRVNNSYNQNVNRNKNLNTNIAKREDRGVRRKNNTLSDLIRILIIRELTDNKYPVKPNYPPRYNRPIRPQVSPYYYDRRPYYYNMYE